MRCIQNYTVELTGLYFHKPLEEYQMIERGYYGKFGGAYLPEILVATFDELEIQFP